MTAALLLAALTLADVSKTDGPQASVEAKTAPTAPASKITPRSSVVVPPGETVELPAASPEAPAYTFHLPLPGPETASREEVERLEFQVQALGVKVQTAEEHVAKLTDAVAGLVRDRATVASAGPAAQSHGCLAGCMCPGPGDCGQKGCACWDVELPVVPRAKVTAKVTAKVATPPTLYRLADVTGQRWDHADPNYLRAWVAQRNASLTAPRAPVWGYAVGGTQGCANGACYRR